MRSALRAVVAGLLLASCGGSGEDDATWEGETVEVLAVWEATEQARFREVLDDFEHLTGAQVRYTSTEGDDIAAVLDDRLQRGEAPDLAVLPLPSLLRQFAEQGVIHAIDDLVGDEVERNYAPMWQDLATVDGSLYGVWFKAAHKSLVWYDVAAFERLGAVPPRDLDGLVTIGHLFADSGVAPFTVGAADGWTLTDWFENVYLQVAGPERYDDLATRRLPWTDRSVHQALDLLGRLLAPEMLAGGAVNALETTFPQSVAQVFGDDPTAAMIAGGDFVAGFISADTDSEVGVDADAFLFPAQLGTGRLVVAGGDAVVALRRSGPADALLVHLASADAGERWASRGGFLSPNENVSLESYPDDRTRTIARSLLEADASLRFDLSDLQPVDFGGTRGAGMLGILQDFLSDPTDVERTARELEAAASSATGR